MNLRYFLLTGFLVLNIFQTLLAQSIPGKIPALPSLPSGLPAGNATAFTVKPEIPYLKELRQIQSLKKSYDSLKTELKEIKEYAQDSTQIDSLVMIAKERGREVLEKEFQVLESLIESEEIPGEEIRNAASRTLEGVNASKERLSEIQNLEGLEALMDQNGENLKALTNEWIMPKVEQVLSGTLEGNWDPTQAKIPDFYGKGALEQLMQEGVPADISFEQAKSMAKEKVLHLSDTYVEELKGKYSKVKFDSLGNIQIIQEAVTKRKFVLLEENKLKDASVLERVGLYTWYDPLTSFGEGIFAEAGLSYGFTQQWEGFGTWVAKRFFDEEEGPIREGDGLRLGLRFTKSTWAIQTSVAKIRMDITYPKGYEQNNFTGSQWSGELALAKTIPMGESIRSVVLVSWDPFYRENRSLSGSAVQLKIGFELFRFKKLGGDVKSRLDWDELEQKIPKVSDPKVSPTDGFDW